MKNHNSYFKEPLDQQLYNDIVVKIYLFNYFIFINSIGYFYIRFPYIKRVQFLPDCERKGVYYVILCLLVYTSCYRLVPKQLDQF